MPKLSSYVPSCRSSEPLTLLNLLTVELGSLAHGLVYGSLRRGSLQRAYFAEARLGACDLVTVLRQLAEELGWDWQDLVLTGEERFIERMKEAVDVENKKSPS